MQFCFQLAEKPRGPSEKVNPVVYRFYFGKYRFSLQIVLPDARYCNWSKMGRMYVITKESECFP
jgi:hypothetical protein